MIDIDPRHVNIRLPKMRCHLQISLYRIDLMSVNGPISPKQCYYEMDTSFYSFYWLDSLEIWLDHNSTYYRSLSKKLHVKPRILHWDPKTSNINPNFLFICQLALDEEWCCWYVWCLWGMNWFTNQLITGTTKDKQKSHFWNENIFMSLLYVIIASNFSETHSHGR